MENKNYVLTPHFDIDHYGCIFEILMPDGRMLYYHFTPNHKLKERLTWMHG